jgi:hypothetical protein
MHDVTPIDPFSIDTHVPTWDILKKYIEKEHYTHPSFILSIHEYNQEGQGLGFGGM